MRLTKDDALTRSIRVRVSPELADLCRHLKINVSGVCREALKQCTEKAIKQSCQPIEKVLSQAIDIIYQLK